MSVSIGRELAKLPCGNQKIAAEAVFKHRLSTREIEKLIRHLMCRPRYEHEMILMTPWEVIERKQPRPTGIAAKLIAFARDCRSISEEVAKVKPEDRKQFYDAIERAISGAEEVIKAFSAMQ